MGFLRRSRPAPEPLPLALPRPDGATWLHAMAQQSFETSTYYEMAIRRAHEPDAHALADRLLEAALPRVSTQASAEDEPYLHNVLRKAAQIGAGLGLVDLVGRKLVHMAEFGLLCFLWWRALRTALEGRRALAAAAAMAILYAASDELHQSFVEGRSGSPVDVLIDTVGVALAAVLITRRSRAPVA